MSLFNEQVAIHSKSGNDGFSTFVLGDQDVDGAKPNSAKPRELTHVFVTFLTTLSCFGVFFLQGMVIARILSPFGRGEFGSAIYFPRDILLYAGLLGGIEIVNAYAKNLSGDSVALKFSAARLGLVSGAITSACAAMLAVIVFGLIPSKAYLIPICLFCCVFVPFEHIHLTISAVDRGTESYSRYNINRFLFALAFPILVLLVFGFDEVLGLSADATYSGFNHYIGMSTLTLMCVLFVLSRPLGLLPTLRGMNVWARLKRRRGESKEANDEIKGPTTGRLLSEGKPYALSMFATELFERLDIFLILALGTMEQAGFYFVAVPAAALLTVAPNALGVFTFNAGADKQRVISLRKGISVMAGIVVVQLIATAFMMLLIPYLIVLFYSDAFSGAIPFALWLLPACAIKGYLQAVDGYLKGCGKPMIGVKARVLSIFLMLVFVWAAFSKFGLLSVPMAACVGQAVSMVIISIAVVRELASQESTNSEPSGGAV